MNLSERIAMAERHIREVRDIVERQRERIEFRRRTGGTVAASVALLANFEKSQAEFEVTLAELTREAYPL